MSRKSLFFVLVLIAVVGTAYFVAVLKNSPMSEVENGAYNDEKYGFSFPYPVGWKVLETTTLFIHPEDNKPAQSYSLFKKDNVELAGDRIKFGVNLFVFKKQRNDNVIITGGPDDLFGYNFTKGTFWHGFTSDIEDDGKNDKSRDREYTWESVMSDSAIQSDVLHTVKGLPILKTGFGFTPNQYSDLYFVVNSDRSVALVFELEYTGTNGDLWASRSLNNIFMSNEQKVADVRDILENLIENLTFSQ